VRGDGNCWLYSWLLAVALLPPAPRGKLAALWRAEERDPELLESAPPAGLLKQFANFDQFYSSRTWPQRSRRAPLT